MSTRLSHGEVVQTGVSYVLPYVADSSLRDLVLSYDNPIVLCTEVTNGSPNTQNKKEQVANNREFFRRLLSDVSIPVFSGMTTIKNSKNFEDVDFRIYVDEYDESRYRNSFDCALKYPAVLKRPDGRTYPLSDKQKRLAERIFEVSKDREPPLSRLFDFMKDSWNQYRSDFDQSSWDEFVGIRAGPRGLIFEFNNLEMIAEYLNEGVLGIRRWYSLDVDHYSDIDGFVIAPVDSIAHMLNAVGGEDGVNVVVSNPHLEEIIREHVTPQILDVECLETAAYP